MRLKKELRAIMNFVHCEEEMKALMKNGKWTLVEPSKYRHIIDSKWVLCIKRDGNGTSIRFKVLIFKIHLVQC